MIYHQANTSALFTAKVNIFQIKGMAQIFASLLQRNEAFFLKMHQAFFFFYIFNNIFKLSILREQKYFFIFHFKDKKNVSFFLFNISLKHQQEFKQIRCIVITNFFFFFFTFHMFLKKTFDWSLKRVLKKNILQKIYAVHNIVNI